MGPKARGEIILLFYEIKFVLYTKCIFKIHNFKLLTKAKKMYFFIYFLFFIWKTWSWPASD